MSTVDYAKQFAYKLAQTSDFITLIRRCEIKNDKERLGLLVVDDKDTPSTPKNENLIVINSSLGEDEDPNAILPMTPQEYKQILNNQRNLPQGWKLKEILFDGIFVYDNIDDMIKAIKSWPYFVETGDVPEQRILGFKCKSGRKWQINVSNFKKSIINSQLVRDYNFSNDQNKILFLQSLNTKPKFKS